MLTNQQDTPTVTLTPLERNRLCVLVVEPDALERNNLRAALKGIGCGGIGDAPSHAAAIERLEQRKFTHIVFDAKKTNFPVKDWLKKVLEMDPTMVAIPSSREPNVDDVFDLLIMGAKGYLCKPFTYDSVEAAIAMATKGEPISEAVLNAKDRNEALVAVMMATLDKAATVMRQAYQFETAKRELPRILGTLRRSADLARTFAKGGDQGLLDSLEKFCIERSKGPATRLGRLRKRLKTGRGSELDEEEGGEGANAGE